jgi:NAD(P)-dependent dehydrogenase (short-subunit alcohol dehydrogenase family)
MRLENKVALVTGAGSGIGRASAILFAREGARVVVADLNSASGQETVRDIKALGGQATLVQVDVGAASDNQRMIEVALESYGRLDILFCNAGVAGAPLADTTEDNWRRTLDINLTGPFLACTYAIPPMRKQRTGNILFNSSVGGVIASGRSPAYAAAKGGLITLGKALAKMLAKENIRVNVICPGATETDMNDAVLGFPKNDEQRRAAKAESVRPIPLGRYAHPEEIANVALFLASDESSFVTGAAYLVDGGRSA